MSEEQLLSLILKWYIILFCVGLWIFVLPKVLEYDFFRARVRAMAARSLSSTR